MCLLQLTGLSGAGKTTLALGLQQWLRLQDRRLEVIDGDVYRNQPGWNLGFSREDRCENIRRLGAIAHGFVLQGIPAVISAINPYASARAELKERYGARTVFVHCALPVLMERDTKGLYRRAFLPEGHPDRVRALTGVSDPYEEPHDADLVLYTDRESPSASIEKLGIWLLTVLDVAAPTERIN
jgi:adenylylsulfate kinase